MLKNHQKCAKIFLISKKKKYFWLNFYIHFDIYDFFFPLNYALPATFLFMLLSLLVASSLASLSVADSNFACHNSPQLESTSVDENSNSPCIYSTPKRPSHLHITASKPNRSEMAELLQPPHSPALSLPSPIASDFELSVLERFDQLMASLGGITASSGLLLFFFFPCLLLLTICLAALFVFITYISLILFGCFIFFG